MKKCFTQCTLEISKREIELLSDLYECLKLYFGPDLARARKLANEGKVSEYPFGYMLMEQMEVLREFKNIKETGDPETPFYE